MSRFALKGLSIGVAKNPVPLFGGSHEDYEYIPVFLATPEVPSSLVILGSPFLKLNIRKESSLIILGLLRDLG